MSTDFEDQQSSFALQVAHYTEYIKNHDGWEFVRVYSDEGRSGTSLRKRTGFQEMLSDGLSGKFDLLITKSVSRFARNTVDSLTAIRRLKEAGVEIYFEKENIRTFDSKGELLITLMSSLAEQESRSISQNIRWGRRKNYEKGIVHYNWNRILGFGKGENWEPVIIESEAKYVREMFDLFLRGFTCSEIATIFTKRGLPTVTGSDKWNPCSIRGMIQNEKYIGDVRLQKNFVIDHLTKKQKRNEGELPQYYVENNHTPIVSRKVFYLVQAEFQRRAMHSRRNITHDQLFLTGIKCGCCGGWYRAELRQKKGELIGYTFRCPYINEKGERCPTHSVSERRIKSSFVKALNELIAEREEIITRMRETANRDVEIKKKELRIDVLNDLLDRLRVQMDDYSIAENGINGYNDLIAEYLVLERERDSLALKVNKHIHYCRSMSYYRHKLNKLPAAIKEFDPSMWTAFLENLTVKESGELCFLFKDGTEIKI